LSPSECRPILLAYLKARFDDECRLTARQSARTA
jgi:hypothetical protein